jgi:hypothetical protein
MMKIVVLLLFAFAMLWPGAAYAVEREQPRQHAAPHHKGKKMGDININFGPPRHGPVFGPPPRRGWWWNRRRW